TLPAVFIIDHRRAGQGKVAAAASEFTKAEAPLRGPRGKANFGDDVVGGQRGGQWTAKEILRLDDPHARLAGSSDLGVAGDGDGRQLSSRIGMRQAGADRAAVADLGMS